jgi:2-polyprenyl-3-methyl-5-hydroxy-6-metoxy-1,4-benzoquinol methylase
MPVGRSLVARPLFLDNLLPRLEFLAQALVRRDARCPHCGARDVELLARKWAVVRIRRCAGCGLAFTDPLYRSRLGDLYDRLYAGQGSTTELPAAERLAALVATRFAGTDKDFGTRIARLRALGPGRRLLEIGSSWGYFLHQAAAGGFEATGVEIASRRAEYGRTRLGVRIVPSLDALAGESFDLVYTSHVLEHFTDLVGVFPRMRELLAPGGALVVEVPHFDWPAGGRVALSSVGAVHPLGFGGEFFVRSLPRHGFRLEGFFERWEDLPQRPLAAPRGANLLCLARPAERAPAR